MALLVIRSGLDRMVSDAKDKLIAPKISLLRKPSVPDISADRRQLLCTFISNDRLSLGVSNKHRQLLFNLARKAEDTLEEYCLGADNLRGYIAAPKISPHHYFSAVRHFEHCLAHLYQAVRCMNALSVPFGGEKQFDPGDGSILERVCLMHNEIKHMDARFESSTFANKTSFESFAIKNNSGKSNSEADAASIANLPMWLTDAGLECGKASITFGELAQEIRELSQQVESLTTIGLRQEKPND
jgi:hypothetical protein